MKMNLWHNSKTAPVCHPLSLSCSSRKKRIEFIAVAAAPDEFAAARAPVTLHQVKLIEELPVYGKRVNAHACMSVWCKHQALRVHSHTTRPQCRKFNECDFSPFESTWLSRARFSRLPTLIKAPAKAVCSRRLRARSKISVFLNEGFRRFEPD